jgi:hypothetical protein
MWCGPEREVLVVVSIETKQEIQEEVIRER